MGFFVKLRIILWKNLTLKIRSPFVLAFEVFIPLVLFVILLMIRHKQMPYPKKHSSFTAKPLPSAGVLPIMQVFCNGNDRDDQGLPMYHNSSLYEFLENLQKMGEQHNFFEPTFAPQDLHRLPELYREVIEDPAAVHDVFVRAQDIKVETVFVNQSELASILESNFSLSQEDVDVIYNSKINFTAVYELLFESSQFEGTPDEGLYPADLPLVRMRRETSNYFKRKIFDKTKLSEKVTSLPIANIMNKTIHNITSGVKNPEVFKAHNYSQTVISSVSSSNKTRDIYNKLLDQIQASQSDGKPPDGPLGPEFPDSDGLIYRIIASDPELLEDPEVRDLILRITGFKGDGHVDPQELIDVMRKVLLSPAGLHYVTCSSDALPHILIPPEANDNQTLDDVQTTLCNMSMERWTALSHVLMEYSSTQAVLHQLNLENTNITVASEHAKEFKENLEFFIMFEEGISRLSRFAANLPQDQCPGGRHMTGNNTFNDTYYDEYDLLTINDTFLDSASQGPHNIRKRHTKKKKVPTATLR